MTTLTVSLGERSYPIVIGQGVLDRAAEEILRVVKPTAVAVLTHPALGRMYADPLVRGLVDRGVRAEVITLPPGERYKNLRTVARLYDALVAAGMDRKSAVVTLGGGVLGDLGGFLAATFLRGIPFVQVPTTLLAQVDASVGGKTGVDLAAGKNLVGAFHQPRAVLIDTETLASLPMRELRAGLAEVVKYGIIYDAAFFARLRADMPALLRRDPAALAAAIERSCEIKAEVVAADETEQGLRAILNFGHTVGHAIEAVTAYRRYKHGEAVAVGMIAAALIGEEIGLTPRAVVTDLAELLCTAGLPVEFPADLDASTVIAAMGRDKKRVGGRISFVLARAIGEVVITPDVPAAAVEAAVTRHRSGAWRA